MTRDLKRLGEGSHDLLVIGGGIQGACAAWDATTRGLSVALVDRGDFGAATSANSLRIIHGGFRYLQSADFRRLREAAVERSILLRIAPHLVRPLPVLVPIYGHGWHGREAFAVALRLADLAGLDRNRHLAPARRIPRGRLLSRAQCLARFGGFDPRGLTGGALWYDAQAVDSERLTLAYVLSAAEAGAAVANYVRAERLLTEGGAVRGARVLDVPTGERFDIRARMVLNAAGPWADELAATARGAAPAGAPAPRLARALNLVTRPLCEAVAVGIRSRAGPDRDPVGGGDRFLFLAPWRGRTLVGTWYRPFAGRADDCRVTAAELAALVADANAACPALDLAPRDVAFYHHGLLPLRGPGGGGRADALADRARIVDHEATEGLAGLVSVVPVKYTTARRVAADAVDRVVARLGRRVGPSRTAETPLYGAPAGGPRAAEAPSEDDPARARLAVVHGDRAAAVAAALGDDPDWRRPVAPGVEILRGEVRHAVRHEMALTLADVVFRRTGLGGTGCPPAEALRATAAVMARELGWDAARQAAEVADVLAAYRPLPAG